MKQIVKNLLFWGLTVIYYAMNPSDGYSLIEIWEAIGLPVSKKVKNNKKEG